MAKFLYLKSLMFMMGALARHSQTMRPIIADGEEGGEGADEVGGEPVVFFALVEEDLEATHGEGEEAEADVIELAEVFAGGLDPGWVVDEAGDEGVGEDADGDVDVEDPAPGVVVGDPAAQGGSDGGGEDGDEAVEGEGLAALLFLEGVGHDGLGHGLESAAADALEDAGDEEDGEAGSEAAEEAGYGEDDDAGEEEVLERPMTEDAQAPMGRMMAFETR